MPLQRNANEIRLARDSTASSLIEILEHNQSAWALEEAQVYYQFPVYKDEDEKTTRAHVLLVSPTHGLTIFECDEVSNRLSGDERDPLFQNLSVRIDEVYSHIFSKLIKSPLLREGRQQLKFNIEQVIFIPNFDLEESSEFVKTYFTEETEFASTEEDLKKVIKKFSSLKILDSIRFREVLAILEGSKGLFKPRERKLLGTEKLSKGHLLQKIEAEIATFDRDQKRAAMNIIDGPQRIRGLAGSGKTVVLAWKVALIHLEDPSAEILYTYNTKILHELIQRLISRFFRASADKEPDWTKIHILHAWGGQALEGVYSRACKKNGRPFFTLSAANAIDPRDPFNAVCKQLLENDIQPDYDYVIIDEGQDFPQGFYQLCLSLARNKRLIWGFDECQNILDIELQDTEKTFGFDKSGLPLVKLDKARPGSQNDIILRRCYRNPREILFFAFGIGLGIANTRVLQMPENNDHWEDLGFSVLEGNSTAGDKMVIERPEANSPLIVNEIFGGQRVLSIKKYESASDECNATVAAIEADLASGLLPEDILVISLDDRNSRSYFSTLSGLLFQKRIGYFDLQQAPPSNKRFTQENCITLSTVYRAKGNEAASVYVIGVDAAFWPHQRDMIRNRNKIFTAITRAKGWACVSGIGEPLDALLKEVNKLRISFPRFEFIMPDRKDLKTFQHDLSNTNAAFAKLERDMQELSKTTGISIEELFRTMESKDKKKAKRKAK